MSLFEPKYEDYQSVKINLVAWSVPLWAAVAIAVYYGALPPDHRAALQARLPIAGEWVRGVGALAAFAVVGVALSSFFVHVLEIHDRVYDRRIVRWRATYDRAFILPELLKPLGPRVPLVALTIAQDNSKAAMKVLFYAFVGDREPKIRKNLVVRFYEVITKYWLTQLMEVAALLVVIIDVVYAALDAAYGAPHRPELYWVLVGGLVAWGLGRIAAVGLRSQVADYTKDEIVAIHEQCGEEFRKAAQRFFKEHNCELQLG